MTPADIRAYVLGGAKGAAITVESPKTGARFTYRTHRPGPNAPIFVSVLTGPDNLHHYRYLGAIFNDDHNFVVTAKSKISPTAPSAVAFRWLWGRVSRLAPVAPVTVHHNGRCGRCGRVLTVPESIVSGLGPVCAAKE